MKVWWVYPDIIAGVKKIKWKETGIKINIVSNILFFYHYMVLNLNHWAFKVGVERDKHRFHPTPFLDCSYKIVEDEAILENVWDRKSAPQTKAGVHDNRNDELILWGWLQMVLSGRRESGRINCAPWLWVSAVEWKSAEMCIKLLISGPDTVSSLTCHLPLMPGNIFCFVLV